MEWLADPSVWLGLVTLIVLEIVLGIDNLVFIAILTEKLAPYQRDRARIVGLFLAMIMRMGLLALLSWLVHLTKPWLVFGPLSFSGRDIILLIGGLFLLFKATLELHDRLEIPEEEKESQRGYARFWAVVVQILVLDAIFSLDSVITAVGMVDHLFIMMLAVVIAISLMMVASKPLATFVNAHPTVVVLCLSFLLMIGFSLVAEGFGFHIPKGYLYAAIGFSIMIEFFNQVASRNGLKALAAQPLRRRTADAVTRLLGGKARYSDSTLFNSDDPDAFQPQEATMVSSVLELAERPVRSIMTPRTDIVWIDDTVSKEETHALLIQSSHSVFPVCSGGLENVLGFAKAKDLLTILQSGAVNEFNAVLKDPIYIHENFTSLSVMQTFQKSRIQMALVTDEYGSIEGLLTPIDLLEAIAGDFLSEDEPQPWIQTSSNVWDMDGKIDIRDLRAVIDRPVGDVESSEYNTLAGFLLWKFGRIPDEGEILDDEGIRFEVLKRIDRRIASVRVEILPGENVESPDVE